MALRSPAAAAVIVPLALLAACSGQSDDVQSADGQSPAAPGRQADRADRATDTAVPGSDDARESAEPPASEPDPEPVSITVGAAGDILPHARVIANANANAGGGEDDYDFSPMFEDVRDLLSEPDLALCHLETPISADNTGLTQPRVLVFNSPTQLAEGLASAGFDGCDFASNHAWDRGLAGLSETQKVVQDAGMTYAGPMAGEDAAEQLVMHEVDGVEVAQLVYSYTLLNAGAPNTDVPEGAPWLEQYLWLERGTEGILADAQEARAAGADFVVVTMHWGNEYQTEPTEQQREVAQELLASDDVDLILGGHAHVIQPCERINDKLVVYGMGNFLSNQSPDTTAGDLRRATQEGLVLQVELTRDPDGTLSSSMTYQPTRVDLEGHVIRLATPEQHPETYQRTVETMNLLGEGACDAEPMS